MRKHIKLLGVLSVNKSFIPLIVCASFTVLVISLLYRQSQTVLKERLRERLEAIASTASLQFNPSDIEKIQTEEDLNSDEMKRVLKIMQRVRDNNSDLRYIYIWRKTDTPNILKFVADAEMIDPIDIDGNGKIEGEEIPPAPGEDYDISETMSVLEGFDHPFALRDFISDRWGTFLSGYAPIRDESGKAIAILGIDEL
ncbi:MAG: hypothetical protein V1784_05750, partial [bacterium]